MRLFDLRNISSFSVTCAGLIGTNAEENGFQKKKEKRILVLFLCFVPCLQKNENCDYYENEARYAFSVIGRQWYARLVIGYQHGIDKQDCSEH